MLQPNNDELARHRCYSFDVVYNEREFFRVHPLIRQMRIPSSSLRVVKDFLSKPSRLMRTAAAFASSNGTNIESPFFIRRKGQSTSDSRPGQALAAVGGIVIPFSILNVCFFSVFFIYTLTFQPKDTWQTGKQQ